MSRHDGCVHDERGVERLTEFSDGTVSAILACPACGSKWYVPECSVREFGRQVNGLVYQEVKFGNPTEGAPCKPSKDKP